MSRCFTKSCFRQRSELSPRFYIQPGLFANLMSCSILASRWNQFFLPPEWVMSRSLSCSASRTTSYLEGEASQVWNNAPSDRGRLALRSAPRVALSSRGIACLYEQRRFFLFCLRFVYTAEVCSLESDVPAHSVAMLILMVCYLFIQRISRDITSVKKRKKEGKEGNDKKKNLP